MTSEEKIQAENEVQQALKEYKSTVDEVTTEMQKAGKDFIAHLEKISKEK